MLAENGGEVSLLLSPWSQSFTPAFQLKPLGPWQDVNAKMKLYFAHIFCTGLSDHADRTGDGKCWLGAGGVIINVFHRVNFKIRGYENYFKLNVDVSGTPHQTAVSSPAEGGLFPSAASSTGPQKHCFRQCACRQLHRAPETCCFR